MNILSRVSVRRYTDVPVTDEEITAILHAAMSAPSAVNRQPWEFFVVDDPELLKRLADALPYAKMAAQAPLAIVVCGSRERFLEGVDDVLWEQDLSAASENILLAAHAIGLGGVWTCLYPHEERIAPVRAILNIPDRMIPFNLIPVGHPEHDHAPMDKWHPDCIHL
jgi:nitroreductase family protein